MSLEVYCFEAADGTPQDWTTQNIVEAREYARRHGLRLLARTYEYADSELVADYTDRETT